MKPSQPAVSEVPEGESLSPIRVLIVDSHQLFRSGLAAGLETDSGIELAGQASRGVLGVKLAAELRPDVILIDLELSEVDGREAIRHILDADESARVLGLTASSSDADIAAAIRIGARGYVLKHAPMIEIISAVRAVHSGNCWTSPAVTRMLFDQLRSGQIHSQKLQDAALGLSARELEVLRRVARGLSNAEVAAELKISPWTAKNHLAHVLAKLDLSNRVQAATYAVRHGLD